MGCFSNASLASASKLPWKFLAKKFILKRPGALPGSGVSFRLPM